MTLWFDLPLELGLTRKGYINYPGRNNLYNEQTLDFYREVGIGYHQLFINDDSSRWKKIDATKTIEVLKHETLTEILKGIHRRQIRKI